MKHKRFIKKFVLRLEHEWLNSKNRNTLTVNEIEILESCIKLMKDAVKTRDKDLEKTLILAATEQLLLLPFIKFKKS